MIGLMPCFLAAFCSSTAPFMTPWSVSARAGWPNSAARAARASILQAPSSSEYSEWTWRWQQPADTGLGMLGAGSDGVGGPGDADLPEGAGSTGGDAAGAVEPRVQDVDGAPVAGHRGAPLAAPWQDRQERLAASRVTVAACGSSPAPVDAQRLAVVGEDGPPLAVDVVGDAEACARGSTRARPPRRARRGRAPGAGAGVTSAKSPRPTGRAAAQELLRRPLGALDPDALGRAGRRRRRRAARASRASPRSARRRRATPGGARPSTAPERERDAHGAERRRGERRRSGRRRPSPAAAAARRAGRRPGSGSDCARRSIAVRSHGDSPAPKSTARGPSGRRGRAGGSSAGRGGGSAGRPPRRAGGRGLDGGARRSSGAPTSSTRGPSAPASSSASMCGELLLRRGAQAVGGLLEAGDDLAGGHRRLGVGHRRADVGLDRRGAARRASARRRWRRQGASGSGSGGVGLRRLGGSGSPASHARAARGRSRPARAARR